MASEESDEAIKLKAEMDVAIGRYFSYIHDGAFMDSYLMQMHGASIDDPKMGLYLRARSEDQSHVTSLGLLSWMNYFTENDAFGEDDD